LKKALSPYRVIARPSKMEDHQDVMRETAQKKSAFGKAKPMLNISEQRRIGPPASSEETVGNPELQKRTGPLYCRKGKSA